MQVAASDIQEFWSQRFPQLYDGKPYVPVPEDRVFAAGQPGVRLPTCDGRQVMDKDWQGNAFYCAGGNYIAYDARPFGLISSLSSEFGDAAVGAVLAHEWGHAVQDRAGNTRVPTIYAELQADCFSGAWVAHVTAGEADGVTLRPGDLDQVLAAMLTFRDSPGSKPGAMNAHGSGFDRVAAFQDGYRHGAQACVPYFRDPPFITEIPYANAREVRSGGNVAAPRVFPASVELLNDFYSRVSRRTYRPVSADDVRSFDPADPPSVFPPCGEVTLSPEDLTNTVYFCRPDRYVVIDVDYMQRVYEEIGDFGVTTLLAVPWATYVQELQGVADAGGSEASSRSADCYTGGFAAAMVLGQLRSDTMRGYVSLSPGDLDEAISAFLDADQLTGGEGDAVFSRVSAFRDGFFDGYDSCGESWPPVPSPSAPPATSPGGGQEG